MAQMCTRWHTIIFSAIWTDRGKYTWNYEIPITQSTINANVIKLKLTGWNGVQNVNVTGRWVERGWLEEGGIPVCAGKCRQLKIIWNYPREVHGHVSTVGLHRKDVASWERQSRDAVSKVCHARSRRKEMQEKRTGAVCGHSVRRRGNIVRIVSRSVGGAVGGSLVINWRTSGRVSAIDTGSARSVNSCHRIWKPCKADWQSIVNCKRF